MQAHEHRSRPQILSGMGKEGGEPICPHRLSASRSVYDVWSNRARKAKVTNYKLVLSFRSQFFHHLRHFSNQANERSTTQRLGSTAKVRSSFRLTTVTVAPEGCVRHRQRAQQVRHRGQAFLMFTERHQCTCSVGDIRGGHGNRMGEPLCIHGTMAFDAGYLLTRVIPHSARLDPYPSRFAHQRSRTLSSRSDHG